VAGRVRIERIEPNSIVALRVKAPQTWQTGWLAVSQITQNLMDDLVDFISGSSFGQVGASRQALGNQVFLSHPIRSIGSAGGCPGHIVRQDSGSKGKKKDGEV
jgi:hypothetical protein